MTSKEDLIRKLKNLINNSASTQGEVSAAEARLQSIMNKYNIDESDIGDDELPTYKEYHYKTSFEFTLLVQLNAYLCNNEYEMYYKRKNGRKVRNVITIEAPESYHKILSSAYEIYKSLYYSELKLFDLAFISKHRLFAATPTNDAKEISDGLTPDEVARLYGMSHNMKDFTLAPQITDGTDYD